MKELKKSVFTQVECADTPQEELALINAHSIKELSADEVFTFSVTLCDNEVDRDYERFTVSALRKLAELFIGKTGICDHSMKSSDQVSRIYKTWLEESETKINVVGEPYTMLKAKAYMPRLAGNAELISEIEAGIKKEVSIGCAVGSVKCSVCGADLRKRMCAHVKGNAYTGKFCHTILDSPTDAYEWSFVAVPAQPAAGVTRKQFDLGTVESLDLDGLKHECCDKECISVSVNSIESLSNEIGRLRKLAEAGEAYRAQLMTEIEKNVTISVSGLACEEFFDFCKQLSTERLQTLDRAFAQKAAEIYPLRPQLTTKPQIQKSGNNEFKI